MFEIRQSGRGDKVASWTHFYRCLHASLCSLFSSYCPRLTGWCNSQQAHSFPSLLFLLSSHSFLSSSFVPSFSLLPFLTSFLLVSSHYRAVCLVSFYPLSLLSFIPPFFPLSFADPLLFVSSFLPYKSIPCSLFYYSALFLFIFTVFSLFPVVFLTSYSTLPHSFYFFLSSFLFHHSSPFFFFSPCFLP